MAVHITREHRFPPGETDAKVNAAVEKLAADNGLSIVERADRRIIVSGMGVTGHVTWDDKEIAIKAEMAFAFGGADTQLRSTIETALDRMCEA